jgi:hypothetical protein
MRYIFSIIIFNVLAIGSVAQDFVDFNQKTNSQPVVRNENSILPFAFAGGMNNCQYGKIDLNLDGIDDLLVFDRHGNRLLPFVINHEDCSYSFHPEYIKYFPELQQWMNLVDYNDDGKADIFTYTTGGIKVFRNVSENEPAFQQVTFPYLKSKQGTTFTNILVTTVDYPSLTDVDGDGDIDVLSFWGLGSFVEWHKNLSVEKYGIPDSLIFEKVTGCWGHFAEGIESNKIILDTCPNEDFDFLKSTKHTGSTLLVGEFNHDHLPDLALGDVDYPGIYLLLNGGTPDDAKMTNYSGNFPNAVDPVQLPSFPSINKLDVNCDEIDDLLVSNFDPTFTASKGLENQWYYEGNFNGWSLKTKSFLQDQMIDLGAGAYPIIIDYNNDQLPDLLVGNYGNADTCINNVFTGMKCYFRSSFTLFRNVGTFENPDFQLADNDFAHIKQYNFQSLIPAAADIDNDGDHDLVCGTASGKLVYLENIALPESADNYVLRDTAYMSIDVGEFSAPLLYDFNKDGLYDLIIGNKSGKLSYYRNSGTDEEADFTHVTDNLGKVDVRDHELSYYGYSVPQIVDFGEKYLLLVGSESGDIFVYDSIDMEHSDEFYFHSRLDLNSGWRTSIASGLVDNDTLPDVFIGNYAGGLQYFGGLKENSLSLPEEANIEQYKLEIYPNPASDRILVTIPGKKNISGLIKISNLSGVSLQTDQIKNSGTSVQLEIPESGMYLITFIPGASMKINYPLTAKLVIIL